MDRGPLKEHFFKGAAAWGSNTAITFLRGGRKETELTYLELDAHANQVAHLFWDAGVRKGDRVVSFMDKCLFFVVAHVALQKIGGLGVPLNPGFKRSEMAYLLQDADPKLVLTGSGQEPLVHDTAPRVKTLTVSTERPYQDLEFFRAAPQEVPRVDLAPHDPGLIVYTSGTTGKPKGAVLTQGNLVHDAENIIAAWEISDRDVLCHALPLFHIHGLCFALHTSLMAGARVLMLDRFSPRAVIEALTGKTGGPPCTLFMGVPSMYATIMDVAGERDLDFPRMRLWTCGSAPLLTKDFERIREVLGQEPVEREGMSETGMNFSNPIRGRRKPGSIGLPLPGLEVRIVDPVTHQDVAPGQTGEIRLRGPGVTPGYWRKPEATAEAFEGGWFKTGDLGRRDEEGYYYLTDRIKHIIISGGENISPKEVEGVINRIPGVVESSVVGVPDQKWGEKVVAAVVKDPGAPLGGKEIQETCRDHLHKWKCPKEIRFLEKLPKNAMGKVLKEEVKKAFEP